MMKNIFKIILCSLVFSMCISCSEEGIEDTGLGKLEGTVVSSGNNEPLENVKITTTPASTTVFTDENGKFVIAKISAGAYSVQADLDKYQTTFQAANITEGVTSNVVFELKLSTANNKPPSAPILISPEDNSIIDSTSVKFIWSAKDPDGDELTFKLELRNDKNSDVEIFEDIKDTTYLYSPLKLGVKYFWQVSASDDINDPVQSAVSSFTVTNSPIGNRILFVRNISGNNVIFSADEAGNEYQLTSENTNSYRPKRNVSADKIAYLQTTGAQVDIYTMRRDGTDKVKVTSNVKPNGFNLNEINIDWPNESDRIYFPNLDKLYSIGSNGQGLQLVYQTPDGSLISEMSVSEKSNLIALKSNNLDGYDVKIFTIDFSGTILSTVLTGVSGAASGLDLSATNKNILYSYDVSGIPSSDYRRWDSRIFIYDMTSGVATEISAEKPAGTNDLEPIFSPNEAFVVYTNTSNDGISQKEVYKLEIGNQKTRILLYTDAFMPDWE